MNLYTHTNLYAYVHSYSHKSIHIKYMSDYTSNYVYTHNFMFMFANYAIFHPDISPPTIFPTYTTLYV